MQSSLPSTPMTVRAAPNAAPPDAACPRVGPFALTALLHAGRWSRVYLARPAGDASGDSYVVKVAAGGGDQAAIARRMLLREALIGKSIAHPHVVSVLASQTACSPEYVVMPYVAGATLREALADGHLIPLAHALWLARQAAAGLDALHRHGWRHADVKPENIHIAVDGHVTLLDLGMAQQLNQAESPLASTLYGTLAYLAPECLVSTSRASAQSDLYSLGVVLYEMLAGRPPFDPGHPARLIQAHLEQTPDDVREHRPDVPREVSLLVKRLLAKAPLRRPASASELTGALCRLEIAALADELAASA